MLSYNDVLEQLQDYILNDENIKKSLTMKMLYVKNEKSIQPKPKKFITENNIKKNELFIPKQEDTLFWCYFIIKNGDACYEILNNKNSLISKQMKIELVLEIRKNKDIIKTYKFDSISNIESNLSLDNNLNMKTFLTLCAINNINIFYICKKTYFELLMNDTNIIYIINELPSQSNYYNKYGFEIATEEKIINIKEKLYKLDTINKPIKTISSYKVEDLIYICNKLAIEIINTDTGKNKLKKDLYESIIQYF
jgi:hypothetical protein